MELPFFVVYWLLFVLAVLAGLFVVFRLIFRNRSDVGAARIFGYSILSLLVLFAADQYLARLATGLIEGDVEARERLIDQTLERIAREIAEQRRNGTRETGDDLIYHRWRICEPLRLLIIYSYRVCLTEGRIDEDRFPLSYSVRVTEAPGYFSLVPWNHEIRTLVPYLHSSEDVPSE